MNRSKTYGKETHLEINGIENLFGRIQFEEQHNKNAMVSQLLEFGAANFLILK